MHIFILTGHYNKQKFETGLIAFLPPRYLFPLGTACIELQDHSHFSEDSSNTQIGTGISYIWNKSALSCVDYCIINNIEHLSMHHAFPSCESTLKEKEKHPHASLELPSLGQLWKFFLNPYSILLFFFFFFNVLLLTTIISNCW